MMEWDVIEVVPKADLSMQVVVAWQQFRAKMRLLKYGRQTLIGYTFHIAQFKELS